MAREGGKTKGLTETEQTSLRDLTVEQRYYLYYYYYYYEAIKGPAESRWGSRDQVGVM